MASLHEEWRTLKIGNGSYQVSSCGRVRSLRSGSPRVLKLAARPDGYLSVWAGEKSMSLVHRLVAQAFLGEPPDGMQVNHIDGDKSNNEVRNLEYVTRKQNMQHALRTGLMPRDGADNPSAKATEEQIRQAHQMVSSGIGVKRVAESLGLPHSVVRHAVNGKTWKHLGLGPVQGIPRGRVRSEVRSKAIDMLSQGMHKRDVAAALGLCVQTIRRIEANA